MLTSHRALSHRRSQARGLVVSHWAGLRFHTDGVARYWSKDWADCYRKLLRAVPVQLNGSSWLNVSFEQVGSRSDDNVITNARFYGVNLLSELDEPSEYYIDPTVRPRLSSLFSFFSFLSSRPPLRR